MTTMQEAMRQVRVNELNRLLPMIRKTIELNKSIWQVEDEINEKKDKLKEAKKAITYFSELLSMYKNSDDEEAKRKFQQLKAQQEEEKYRYTADINTIAEREKELSKRWEFDAKLYRNIVNVICTEGGFLERKDIQEEFLKEYIYLLLLGDIWGYDYIKAERIFCISDTELWELVKNKFSKEHAQIIIELDRKEATMKMFFELFG